MHSTHVPAAGSKIKAKPGAVWQRQRLALGLGLLGGILKCMLPEQFTSVSWKFLNWLRSEAQTHRHRSTSTEAQARALKNKRTNNLKGWQNVGGMVRLRTAEKKLRKPLSQEVEMKIYLPICLFIFGSTRGSLHQPGWVVGKMWVKKLPAKGNYVKYRRLKRQVGVQRAAAAAAASPSRVLRIVSML